MRWSVLNRLKVINFYPALVVKNKPALTILKVTNSSMFNFFTKTHPVYRNFPQVGSGGLKNAILQFG
jgi:hypothetical protein